MKLAILLPNLVGGGVERIRIVLAREFTRQGFDVQFVLMQAHGELLEEAEEYFSVVDLGVRRARALPAALFHYLRRERPDAILAAIWPLTVIAPLVQRLSGVSCEVLVSEHNTLSIQYEEWGRLHRSALRISMAVGYRLATGRVAVSSGVKDDISALSWLPRDAFNVIYNPLPPRADPSVRAMQEAEALWLGPAGGRVLTVGSMKKQKNHQLLLHAFALINRPNARLMFVGDGEGRDALVSLADKLGVANRVIFAGFRSDPTPFYKSADLFALSSNYEGFGNVVVEALACGTPVVSTDCPSGPAEILEDGKFGGLVAVNNVEDMAKGLTQYLDHPVDPTALIERARDFTVERAAAAYLELLKKI